MANKTLRAKLEAAKTEKDGQIVNFERSNAPVNENSGAKTTKKAKQTPRFDVEEVEEQIEQFVRFENIFKGIVTPHLDILFLMNSKFGREARKVFLPLLRRYRQAVQDLDAGKTKQAAAAMRQIVFDSNESNYNLSLERVRGSRNRLEVQLGREHTKGFKVEVRDAEDLKRQINDAEAKIGQRVAAMHTLRRRQEAAIRIATSDADALEFYRQTLVNYAAAKASYPEALAPVIHGEDKLHFEILEADKTTEERHRAMQTLYGRMNAALDAADERVARAEREARAAEIVAQRRAKATQIAREEVQQERPRGRRNDKHENASDVADLLARTISGGNGQGLELVGGNPFAPAKEEKPQGKRGKGGKKDQNREAAEDAKHQDGGKGKKGKAK